MRKSWRRGTMAPNPPESVSSPPSSSSATITPCPSTQQEPATAASTTMPSAEVASSASEDASSSRSQSQGPTARNFPHPDFTDIGIMMKEVNDTLGDLQLLGVSHDVPLPELVLVGDQSSGKSSLMSALARLNLPTSSGICTRCPFHIHMRPSRDSHWSCTVSIQQEYLYRPDLNRPIRRSDVTRNSPFAPWIQKPTVETTTFKTVYEQDSIGIDEILRWAQIATLNPSRDPQHFVPGEGSYAKETDLESAAQATEARFSPNVVFLEMKGPDFPPLSFYDLPGIFAIAEMKGDDYLVDVVENLTRKYVNHEKAIIMLALPMDHDIDNSRALRIIRDSNAEDRTIGILTKADRVDLDLQDKVAYWLTVLQGKRQTVGHGFFTTSLPPNVEPQALKAYEESFFRTGAQWPRAFDEFVNRCGVDELRVHVRKQLGEAFTSSLPETKEKLGFRLHAIECELRELPELPGNVEHKVRMSLKNFNASVKSAVSEQAFEQKLKEHTEDFYRCLIQLKPKCNMVTEPRQVNQAPETVIAISDTSDDEPNKTKRPSSKDTPIATTPKRRRLSRSYAMPIKAETATTPSGRVGFQSPATPSVFYSPMVSTGHVFPRMSHFKLSLLQIQQQIKRTTRGGFSHIVPLEVHEGLCLRAVAEWETPLMLYISKANEILIATVTKALGESLGDFSRRLIFKESEEYLTTFLREKGIEQTTRLEEIYNNEKYRVVTINEQGLHNHKAKEKAGLERFRLIRRAKAAELVEDDRDFRDLETLTPEEKLEESKLFTRWLSQLPEDEFKREIDVAATVRSYYLVAATRFTDAVSMDINSHLFRSLREGALENYLEQKLGLSPCPTRDKYNRLMEEDESTSQKRDQLKRARDKFKTAIQKIASHELSSESYSAPRYEPQPRIPLATEKTRLPAQKSEEI